MIQREKASKKGEPKLKKILFLITILFFLSCSLKESKPEKILDDWKMLLEEVRDDSIRINEVKSEIRNQASELSQSETDPEKLFVAFSGFQLLENHQDSLRAEKIKNTIIEKFPESEQTYNLANSEFYDKVYPIWRNDSLKIEVISELLLKYPKTNWRRTMYLYLLYSLQNEEKINDLKNVLSEFRNAFPDDYLPYVRSASYLFKNKTDSTLALELARKGFSISFDYPTLDYFPPMEWDLEKRAASVNSATILTEILVGFEEYSEAKEILLNIIDNNQLGIDDETTLGQCYYLLAKSYEGLQEIEKAKDSAINAIISGDSRNVYTSKSDTLFREFMNLQQTDKNEVISIIRNRINYEDVEFTDVSEEYGLKDIPAGRIAWGDFDNDGFQDMLLNGNRLFRNDNGRYFTEVTKQVFPDTIRANGGLWGDFNNDGNLDIVTKEPESIWLNFNGIFKKATGENSLKDNEVSTEGIGIGDVNNDGFIDIYFANYEKNYVYETDQFFVGIGNGKFQELTEKSGLIPKDGKNRAGRGVNFGDFDNDSNLDIFVSNYRLTENFLWKNDGTGVFTNEARNLGVSGIEIDNWWGHTIGSEWGDFDNDGDFDLITANLAHPRYIDFSNKTMLYENLGDPNWKFKDIRRSAGIRFEETHSEPAWGDLNNDGFLDLYINCVYEGRRSFLYMNNGDKTFREITFLAGVRHFNGWGVAFADLDNDGDLDILAAGGKIQLFRNETPNPGNWLEVKVVSKDHVDGIGTRLTLSNEKINLIREIQGGKGTTNQHSLVQHFGLGNWKIPFELEVRFPSGKVKNIKINKLNRLIEFRE